MEEDLQDKRDQLTGKKKKYNKMKKKDRNEGQIRRIKCTEDNNEMREKIEERYNKKAQHGCI